jgi:hypothetical protein
VGGKKKKAVDACDATGNAKKGSSEMMRKMQRIDQIIIRGRCNATGQACLAVGEEQNRASCPCHVGAMLMQCAGEGALA